MDNIANLVALYVVTGIIVSAYLLWWSPKKREALREHWIGGFAIFNWVSSGIGLGVMVAVWPLHLLVTGRVLWRNTDYRVFRDALPRARDKWATVPKTKRYAWFMGTGMILLTIHNANQPWIDYIMLPWIGFILMAIAAWRYSQAVKLDMGPKRIWIPLALISLSIVISGALEWSTRGLATMSMGVLLFGMYCIGRQAGRDVLTPFKWAIVAILAVLYVNAFLHPGIRTGGFYGGFEGAVAGNYAMAIRLLIFGGLTMVGTNQWKWVAAIAAGVFVTGGEEGLLIAAILGIAMLVRRDISRKVLLPVGVFAGLVLVLWPMGIPQMLYSHLPGRMDALTGQNAIEERLDGFSGVRFSTYVDAIENVKPLGNGYYMTDFATGGNVHSVPLMIMDQIGPGAAIAWLWVTLFILVKSRWRYMFIGILAMSLLDHALWTQAAPWWWVVVGVASTSALKSDKIFATGGTEYAESAREGTAGTVASLAQ